MKKTVKIVTLVFYVLLAGVVLVEALVYLPKLFGIQPLAVLSGSMEPNYHVGSMVYVKKTDASSLEVGDAVTFYITGKTMVTHRVVEKDDAAQLLTTKGDANLNTQEQVPYDQVIGKVLFNIPWLGYITSWFSTVTGKIIIFGMIVVVLLLSFLPGQPSQKGRKREKDE